jgi:hypothetical protein
MAFCSEICAVAVMTVLDFHPHVVSVTEAAKNCELHGRGVGGECRCVRGPIYTLGGELDMLGARLPLPNSAAVAGRMAVTQLGRGHWGPR